MAQNSDDEKLSEERRNKNKKKNERNRKVASTGETSGAVTSLVATLIKRSFTTDSDPNISFRLKHFQVVSS